MASIIAVPRRATLHDVVQHVMCMDAVGLANNDVSKSSSSAGGSGAAARIPSDHKFWKSLRLAVKQHPEATQSGKRMLRIHESTTNETLIVEQQFLKEFVAAYEADATYQVTVAQEQLGGASKPIVGLRTFFCNQEFWDHVLLSFASTVSGGGGGAVPSSPATGTPKRSSKAASSLGPYESVVLSVRITRVEHMPSSSSGGSPNSSAAIGSVFSRKVPGWLQNLATLQMTAGEWNSVVESWNALHVTGQDDDTDDARAGGVAASAAASAAMSSRSGENEAQPDPTDEDDNGTRRRSHAVFGPDSSFDLVADARARLDELTRGQGKKKGSRYWTHFMYHWGLLEAQCRNYL